MNDYFTIIARMGDFELRRKTFVSLHNITTHDIEIVKYNDNFCYTIASFNEKNELTSCGNRLINNINTEKELANIKYLIDIAERILNTDNIALNNIK